MARWRWQQVWQDQVTWKPAPDWDESRKADPAAESRLVLTEQGGILSHTELNIFFFLLRHCRAKFN